MTVPPPLVRVVDDDASFRRSIARLLRSAGYEVETFSSAEDYLAADQGCACLVLDIHMKGQNGLELVQDLVAHGRAVPVVFVTAHDTPAVSEQARHAGAAACLPKPVAPVDLMRAIAQAVADSGRRS
jgi:FixJ family two-component response regulator